MGVVDGMGLLVAAIAASSCWPSGCQNKLHDENKQLCGAEPRAAGAATAKPPSSPRPTRPQVSALQGEIAAARREDRRAANQLRQPDAGQAAPIRSIAGIETSFDQATGEMTVNLPGDVLFDAGRADAQGVGQGDAEQGRRARSRRTTPASTSTSTATPTPTRSPRPRASGRTTSTSPPSARRAVGQVPDQPGRRRSSRSTPARFGATQPEGNDKEPNRRVEIVVATR